uniref:Unknow n=1 Tax=Levilactobacillus zymae TaxID=267363 RepID=A0A7G8AFL4_9LACO|nr:Unknow [Levilactobacillus zymae]
MSSLSSTSSDIYLSISKLFISVISFLLYLCFFFSIASLDSCVRYEYMLAILLMTICTLAILRSSVRLTVILFLFVAIFLLQTKSNLSTPLLCFFATLLSIIYAINLYFAKNSLKTRRKLAEI